MAKLLITIDKKTLKTLSDEVQGLFYQAIQYAAQEIYASSTGNFVEFDTINLEESYPEFEIVARVDI